MENPAAAEEVALKSKQKNCQGCVQTKRRCDRRAPVCSRCAERGTACVYGKAAPYRYQVQESSIGSSYTTPFAGQPVSATPAWSPLAAAQMPLDAPPHSAPASTPDLLDFELMDTGLAGDISTEPFFPDPGDSIAPFPDQWRDAAGESQTHLDRPSTPADEEVLRGYSHMSDACVCSKSLFVLQH